VGSTYAGPNSVVFLDGGVVVEAGRPAAVLDHPREPRTQAFISRIP
jgi:polar amino acid transport system ATP-binding protein